MWFLQQDFPSEQQQLRFMVVLLFVSTNIFWLFWLDTLVCDHLCSSNAVAAVEKILFPSESLCNRICPTVCGVVLDQDTVTSINLFKIQLQKSVWWQFALNPSVKNVFLILFSKLFMHWNKRLKQVFGEFVCSEWRSTFFRVDIQRIDGNDNKSFLTKHGDQDKEKTNSLWPTTFRLWPSDSLATHLFAFTCCRRPELRRWFIKK